MCGFALAAYDGVGKILYFGGAAFRRKEAENTDAVILITPEMILAGMQAGKQPEPELITLTGDAARGDYTVNMTEIPWLSARLGHLMPTAAGWGILRVAPGSDKHFIGHLPNGTNSEIYVDPRSWQDMRDAGAVPGSGSNDLLARLAPEAEAYAETLVSAWDVTIVMCHMFGGFSKLPKFGKLGSCNILKQQNDSETKQRNAKKASIAAARAARYAGGSSDPDLFADYCSSGSVSAAFDVAHKRLELTPAQIAAMNQDGAA